jgi:hypothetical protein
VKVIRGALISSTAHPLKGSVPIWIDLHAIIEKIGVDEDLFELTNRFSLIIPSENSAKLYGARIDDKHSIEVDLEMYGGHGISTHAGGARSLILDDFLLKGVGVNKLLGTGSKSTHSDGSLSFIDGAVEFIYSRLLDSLLPKGAVQGLGLIFTGADTSKSNHPNQKYPAPDFGAIFIRSASLRPASFLPAGMYQGGIVNIPVNDPVRLHEQFKELLVEQGSPSGLIEWFAQFAVDCADQFSYAFVNGIMHGSLSESNFSLCSKWLDLTLSTFVDNRINYVITSNIGVPCFYDEYKYPPRIFSLFLWELSKYIGISINSKPIVDLYFRTFSNKIEEYIADYLCVDRCYIAYLRDGNVLRHVFSFLKSKPKLVFASPLSSAHDDEVEFFVVMLSCIRFGYDICNIKDLRIRKAIEAIALSADKCDILSSAFEYKVARRIVLLGYRRVFYRARVIEEFRAQLYNSTPSTAHITSLVEIYLNVIESIFKAKDSPQGEVFIYSDTRNKLIFKDGILYLNNSVTSESYILSNSTELFDSRILISDVVVDILSAFSKSGLLQC